MSARRLCGGLLFILLFCFYDFKDSQNSFKENLKVKEKNNLIFEKYEEFFFFVKTFRFSDSFTSDHLLYFRLKHLSFEGLS